MDVICLKDKKEYYHCSNFYIKFRIPKIEQTTNLILGISTIDSRTPLQEKFLEAFPTATDGELTEMLKQDLPYPSTPLTNHNEPELVDIYTQNQCNPSIIAFIGNNLLLYFYDPSINHYFLTPNQTILQSFHLQPGKNHIKCLHRSTQMMKTFTIYLYDKEDSLVIMDIDGTITKSDVTGYIQTVYLKLYSYIHEGVIEFLNYLVETYHYHILYLTARPMAHRTMTMNFLQQSRNDNGLTLPDGPLITSRDGISTALFKEVILKDSAQTKCKILTHIVDVFRAAGSNMMISPFVLGIGNKESDAIAYNGAGLSSERILLIDKFSQIQIWKYAAESDNNNHHHHSNHHNYFFSTNNDGNHSNASSTRKKERGSGSAGLSLPFPLYRNNSGKQSPVPVAPPPTPSSSTTSSRETSRDSEMRRSTMNSLQSSPLVNNPHNLFTVIREEDNDADDDDDVDDEEIPFTYQGGGRIGIGERSEFSGEKEEKRQIISNEEEEEEHFRNNRGTNDQCRNCYEEVCRCLIGVPPATYTFTTYKDPQLYRYIEYLSKIPVT